MMPPVEDAVSRHQDVRIACAQGLGYAWLAPRWGLSPHGAWQWCRDHATAWERQRLAEPDRAMVERVGRERARAEAKAALPIKCSDYAPPAARPNSNPGKPPLVERAKAPKPLFDHCAYQTYVRGKLETCGAEKPLDGHHHCEVHKRASAALPAPRFNITGGGAAFNPAGGRTR